MLPPDKELLRRTQQYLNDGRHEELEDMLVRKLGEQEEGPLPSNQQDLVRKLRLHLQRRLEPRTAMLILMHQVDDEANNHKQYERTLLLYNELLKRRMCNEPYLALYNIAVCEENSGRVDAALFNYSRTLKHRPGFWPAVLNYSVLLSRLGRNEESRGLLDNYLNHHPSRRGLELQWIAASNRTHYHEVMKRYRGKRLHYQIVFNLALYLKRIGRGIESIRLLRNVERVAKESKLVVSSCLLRGKIYEEHRKYEEAISSYRAVVQKYGQHGQILSPKILQLEVELSRLNDSNATMLTGRIPLSPLIVNPTTEATSRQQNDCSMTIPSTVQESVTSNLRSRKLRYLLDKEKEIGRYFDRSSNGRRLRDDCLRNEFEQQFQQTKQRFKEEKLQRDIQEVAAQYLHSMQRKLSGEVLRTTRTSQPRATRKKLLKKSCDALHKAENKAVEQPQNTQFNNTLGFILTGFPTLGKPAISKGMFTTQGSATKESEHASVSVLEPDEVIHTEGMHPEVNNSSSHPAEDRVVAECVVPAVVQEPTSPALPSCKPTAKSIASIVRNSFQERPKPLQPLQLGLKKPSDREPSLQIIPPSQQKIDIIEPKSPTKPAFQASQGEPQQLVPSQPTPTRKPKAADAKSTAVNHSNPVTEGIKKQTKFDLHAEPSIPLRKGQSKSQPRKQGVKFNKQLTKRELSQQREAPAADKSDAQTKKQSPEILTVPEVSIKYLEECRSIREIMQNPLFGKKRDQSIKVENDVIKECELKDVSNEVDLLLSKEQHDKALDIYKKDYKEATTVELKAEALLKIAWVFERSGYLENARKTYDKCLKLGMDIRAFVKLGELQIRMGFIEEGIDNLEKATCILREDEEIKLKLAYGYSMLEMGLGKALAITNEILLKDPTNLRAIMLSSNIHQKMGNIDIALEISRAIDSSRNNESIKHYIGLLYLQKQEIQTAYTSFKEALRINPRKALQIEPKNMSALTRLARLYETELSDNQKAIETYSKVLAVSETYETYEHLGNCYYRCGKFREAIEHYKLAITLNCSAFAWKRIAECYENLKHYDRALNYFELALSLEPSEELHRRIGTCQIYLENFKAAIRSLRQAVELQDSAECQSLIANCYYLLEEYEMAIEHYQKSIDLDDSNVNTLYNMAICFDQKEQFLVSRGLYEAVLQLDPTHTSSLYNLANIMLVLGKNSESAALFQRALAHQPDNYPRRLELIELYETMNDLNRAEQHLLNCYRQNDQDAEVLEKLIRVYRKKKDIKKVNRYQKLLLAVKSGHSGFRTKTQN